MVIYGVALLGGCMLAGVVIGGWLGDLIGIDANVGGIGIAMLLLILTVDYLEKRGKLNQKSKAGLSFWSAMYIPIVVAMAAQQNVVTALKGGPLAIMAGLCATLAGFFLVPVLSGSGVKKKAGHKNEGGRPA
ncbi:malonate transporter subunit MadL [Desmospora activa]|uniref:Malonate transporter MadL subunit n=1 Tax=Desmospora activa DSM 45169 TaxID=1121389 RepID=A0A2T4Z4P0_9BACL|nr:malonate transporter subunit MadL [Desmospora activa]PTM56861.1 malonate transporter MadL subunit [Desmospora activa DSM 45169]